MRTSLLRGAWLVPVVAAALGAQRPAATPPDLVLVNAKVFTADSTRPWAEGLAIRGDRIVAVASSAEIAKLAGPTTRRIDLAGRVVVPGFNDAHAHLGCLNTRTRWVRTAGGPVPDPSLAELTDSLRALAAREPEGTWLAAQIGARVMEDSPARRAALDRIAPRHPVMLFLFGGHGAVLNTAALRVMEIEDDAADPQGGRYEREPGSRRLDGAMREYAVFAFARRFCSSEPESTLVRQLQEQGRWMLRHGITSVQTFDNAFQPGLTVRVLEAARLPVRVRIVSTPFPSASGGRLSELKQTLASAPPHAPGDAGMLTVSGVKWILDGTPIERGAAHRVAYRDRPGHSGVINFPPDTIRAMLLEALALKQQPHLHAGGDSTIAVVLDQLERTGGASVWAPVRVRIEHGDAVMPDLVARARHLGVVVVQNPTHFALAEMLHVRYDAATAAMMQPLRSLHHGGIPIAFGADANDATMNPFLNVMFATTHPVNPKEALTREQAVTAYTLGSAYAERAERNKGTLAPGMLADLAVLSQDIFVILPPRMPATTSVLTIVGGRIVFDELTTAR